jgi:diadenosine tetraphosphatase ApaH/serine/threonine PP2A family protein phosphatase
MQSGPDVNGIYPERVDVNVKYRPVPFWPNPTLISNPVVVLNILNTNVFRRYHNRVPLPVMAGAITLMRERKQKKKTLVVV